MKVLELPLFRALRTILASIIINLGTGLHLYLRLHLVQRLMRVFVELQQILGYKQVHILII